MPVTDTGLKRKRIGSYEVTVGIHESDNARRGAGLTNAQLGAIHEFGMGVPQRSFLRRYWDEHEAEIEADLISCADRVLAGEDPERVFALFALKHEAGVKDGFLDRSIKQDLSLAVRKKRGESAAALVDSSQLLGSVKGVVKKQ